MYRNDCRKNTCTKSLASIRHDMGSEGQTNKGEEGVTVGHSGSVSNVLILILVNFSRPFLHPSCVCDKISFSGITAMRMVEGFRTII